MFPQFGEHATGMLQIQVWTAIELEGLGANLQHFQCFPPAEAALRKEFNLPETWNLTAHLNIGNEQAPHPPIPDKKPFSETLKVFKA
jgi:predicted oxidoreductase (fatty acid repression mutant protein)